MGNQQTLIESQDEINVIRQEIQSIENGLSDSSLVRLFSETKKSSVLYLAEKYERLYELQASEIPTNQIANYLVKKFEKLGVRIHHSTIYDNLPQKYKTHIPNPDYSDSENPNENSSHISLTFEQENEDLIEYWQSHLDTVKMIITKLKTNAFASRINPDELQESLHLMHFANKLVNECFDDRISMPTATQHIALQVFAEEPAKYAASKYIQKIKKFGGFKVRESIIHLMSFKQFRKLLNGRVKELRDLYEPKSKNEAMERGYYGMRCTDMQCKSWRVIYEPILEKFMVFENNKKIKKSRMVNLCKCYHCGRVMKPRTERLPKESPGITVDWHSG